ncbi:MAG TPA: hypothetical protein VGI31_07995 [Streptosporangiaceae bacterium]|jgi:hypothetical protein
MTFADTFAADLGQRTGSTVDAAQIPDSDTVNADLQALTSFTGGLGATDSGTLDIIAESGVDLSGATDDSGNPVVPGGELLTLAASAGETLASLLDQAQQSFTVALDDSSPSEGDSNA